MKRGIIPVISAILLWSSQGIIVRYAGVDVHLLIFYANLLSLFIIGPMVLCTRRRQRIPGRRGLVKFLALGPVTLLNTFTFLYALKNTTITNAMMTHYIAPVIVALLAAAMLSERFTLRVVTAIIISSLGLWILFGQGPASVAGLGAGPVSLNGHGIAAGLVSGVAYAVLIVLVRVLAPGEDPVVIVFFQNIMMCVLLLPFISEFPAGAAWSFALSGMMHSTLAPLLYVRGLKTVKANTTAILGYLEPVSAILLGIVLLGEIPGPIALFGGALIITSGLIVITGEGRDKPPEIDE